MSVLSLRIAVDNDDVSMVADAAPPLQYDVTVIPANRHAELYIQGRPNGPIFQCMQIYVHIWRNHWYLTTDIDKLIKLVSYIKY